MMAGVNNLIITNVYIEVLNHSQKTDILGTRGLSPLTPSIEIELL